MLKKLPIGIQTFSEIIEENYLYIDKTKDALNLIENYKYTFLSRPRRFGKSLFLDTMQEIFEGNKELFKGLYIYDKWDWDDKYPVIKISFSGDLRSEESLKDNILSILEDNQERLKVDCKNRNKYGICFKELIKNTYKKYNKKVVVLVDEYDKAILDNLDQMEVAEENREIIKSLYTVLKDLDRYLKFVFLTGVSKFSRASIFSGLNMLKDISLAPKYGNICGYTQNDIETTFLPYLEGVDLEKLKVWYNGYNFLKDDMYNPFDILLFIDGDFLYDNYWFNTGTPSFLIKLIKKNSYLLPKLANLTIGKELLDSFDIDNLNFEVILFQAGYLTIQERLIDENDEIEYRVKLPNIEVKKSLNNYIIKSLTNNTNPNIHKKPILKALKSADMLGLKLSLISMFTSIPNDNYRKNQIANYEGFYASIIYIYFQSLGIDIIGEDVTNRGRIDLTLKVDDLIYILEFKMGSDDALEQIKSKNYQQKYLSQSDKIYLVGINFDEEERGISRFEWEKVKK